MDRFFVFREKIHRGKNGKNTIIPILNVLMDISFVPRFLQRFLMSGQKKKKRHSEIKCFLFMSSDGIITVPLPLTIAKSIYKWKAQYFLVFRPLSQNPRQIDAKSNYKMN